MLFRSGVTANCVCPGPTDTPALRKFIDGAGDDADKVIGGMKRGVPMKRLAKPTEVGELFAFLGSDEASYLTGSQVVIDGGSTLPETMSIGTN